MFGSRDMLTRRALLHLAALSLVVSCIAGPLGPLPNVTSSDLGLKEGSCSLGDMVYARGDQFPGSSPCERCTCSERGVRCERQVCEPRPGCKALHRPDHCCPTYQCECEQEGHVYGNGEKLVDPADPCRVCYCQGGEVVCRRIACFVRDDCTPRLVPGRCCPEYDNCPLRGVTVLPGVSSPISSAPNFESVESPPVPHKENSKPEITIKEITPVSEIPVITDVKIKEILPSSSFEVAEYVSSKSPLIPREATSEKNIVDSKTDIPIIISEINSASPIIVSSPEANKPTKTEIKETDATPSKISFSTQDSINSDIYPSIIPAVATMGAMPVTAEPVPIATTKAPNMEEEDTFDHNPAFPPLPDDLAVLRNHDDEIVPEVVVDNEHVPSHDIFAASVAPSTEAEIKELLTTSFRDTTTRTTTEKSRTTTVVATIKEKNMATAELVDSNESGMLNLRSAIPTEILNSPSSIPEEITGELDETTTDTEDYILLASSTLTTVPKMFEEISTIKPQLSVGEKDGIESSVDSTTMTPGNKITTSTESESTESQKAVRLSSKEQEQTTSSIAKSHAATDVTLQTELSSLPVETSDQNPPEVSTKDEAVPFTPEMLNTNSNIPLASSETITVGRTSSDETFGFENVETTEFILTSFGSAETATDPVELIKISADAEKSAAIIESPDNNKNNVLTDLINLVSDVASMSDHTEEPNVVKNIVTTIAPGISDSEELIPVNAGYKSKNKNFNQNSITEIPTKTKQTVKQKVVEIEDDDSETVTDSPPPYDNIEPTTRRPIIDNVSAENMPGNKTEKKDIEIITQSYVPTINKRPTKVIMKAPVSEETPREDASISASAESITEGSLSSEVAQTTDGDIKFPSEAETTRLGAVNATSGSAQ